MLSHFDAPLFCTLYKSYRYKTYSVALNILRNAHDAEDASQSAWERVIRHFHTAREHWTSSRPIFERWLIVIVSNIAKNVLGKKKRLVAILESWSPRPAMETEIQDKYQMAIDAIYSMPERSCDVLERRLIHECRFKDIGYAFGCSEDAARMRYNRALKALKVRLCDEPLNEK